MMARPAIGPAPRRGKEGWLRMIPGQFDYVRPGSLDEALRILRDREGEAKVLSGGYSLLPLIKLRLAQPALLVDIQGVRGLDGIIAHRRRRAGSAPGQPTARSSTTRSSRTDHAAHRATRRAASATRRSATGGPSGARARTPTLARTGRRS